LERTAADRTVRERGKEHYLKIIWGPGNPALRGYPGRLYSEMPACENGYRKVEKKARFGKLDAGGCGNGGGRQKDAHGTVEGETVGPK